MRASRNSGRPRMSPVRLREKTTLPAPIMATLIIGYPPFALPAHSTSGASCDLRRRIPTESWRLANQIVTIHVHFVMFGQDLGGKRPVLRPESHQSLAASFHNRCRGFVAVAQYQP